LEWSEMSGSSNSCSAGGMDHVDGVYTKRMG
jgi:hypothetical protein